MTKSVLFDVGMTCGGCSAAVTRILKKVEGMYGLQRTLLLYIYINYILVQLDNIKSVEIMTSTQLCSLSHAYR